MHHERLAALTAQMAAFQTAHPTWTIPSPCHRDDLRTALQHWYGWIEAHVPHERPDRQRVAMHFTFEATWEHLAGRGGGYGGQAQAIFAALVHAGVPWGLCHEDAQASCCTRDEGRPFEVALEGEASNSQKLLRTKAVVVNILVKRRDRDHVMYG